MNDLTNNIEEKYKLSLRLVSKKYDGIYFNSYQFLIIKTEYDALLDYTSFETVSYGKIKSYIYPSHEYSILSKLRILKNIIISFNKIKNISNKLCFEKESINELFLIEDKSVNIKGCFTYILNFIQGNFLEEQTEVFEKKLKEHFNDDFIIKFYNELNIIKNIYAENSLLIERSVSNYVTKNSLLFQPIDKKINQSIKENIIAFKGIKERNNIKNNQFVVDKEKNNKIILLQSKSTNLNLLNIPLQHQEYNIYTDASLNVKKKIAGYGIVLTSKDQVIEKIAGSFHLLDQKKGAIQLAEIRAIYEILRFINDSAKEKNMSINIFSDSLDSIRYLNNKPSLFKKNKGNFRVIKEILESINKMKIKPKFYFVKGHKNNKFNILADKIAGLSAKNNIGNNIGNMLIQL